MHKKICLLLVIIFAFPLSLKSNGYKIYEWGARGAALSGAFIAGAEGPTSIFYNPAGMVNQEGSGLYFGGFYTSRQYNFYSPDLNLSVDSEKFKFFIPSLAFTYQLSSRLWLGLGVYSPDAYKIHWPFTKRHPLVYQTRKMDLQTYTLTPGIAWKISDRFSLGLNLGINYSTLENQIHFDYDYVVQGLTSGQVMDAEDFILTMNDGRRISFAFTFGLQWKIVNRLKFGLSLSGDLGSRYKMGYMEFKETDTPFPEANEFLASHFRDSPGQGVTYIFWSIPSVKAGLAWNASDSFSLEMAVYFDIWPIMDAREVVFEPEIVWRSDLDVNVHFKSTFSLRAGSEIFLSKLLSLRLGAYYDPSPAVDEHFTSEFPFTTQIGVTFGLGYHWKRFFVDLGYRLLAVSGKKVKNDLLDLWLISNQEYAKRTEHLFCAGLGYRF